MGQVLFDTGRINDIPYLKKMWKDIFKDDDSYIDLFFSYKFKEGNTFVIRDNGKIISTLYVEYTDIFIDEKIYKGAYFCGIATLSEYRKKGYAKKLIEYAKENIKNVDIIYLIPANESLFDFYKEAGFRVFTCLDKEKVIVDGEFVNMYNKERLLVELIRKRNQIPFDYYKEIIGNYRKIADELDMYKIEQYIALYKNECNLGNILLREVF